MPGTAVPDGLAFVRATGVKVNLSESRVPRNEGAIVSSSLAAFAYIRGRFGGSASGGCCLVGALRQLGENGCEFGMAAGVLSSAPSPATGQRGSLRGGG